MSRRTGNSWSTPVGVAAFAAFAAAATWSCGDGGPVCGDGILEGDEQCDDGNTINDDGCNIACLLPSVDTTDLAVGWAFNADVAPGFAGDSCFDIGGDTVEVAISGPQEESKQGPCGFGRVTFLNVAPGTYDISVRVLDSDGALLTRQAVSAQVDVGTDDVMETVNVPPDAWARDYEGTFYFRLTWAGEDCSTAKPAVVEHVLLLERDGRPLGGFLTDANDPIDGSGPGDCRSVDTSIEEFPQSVRELPFGPAEFEIIGYDADGAESYRGRFETFVGAGIGNPELVFDVALTVEEPGDGGDGDGGDGDGDGGP